jgi:hypothetical protein
MSAAQQTTGLWWKPNGSSVVHEVLWSEDDIAFVATLRLRGGWRTQGGKSIEHIGRKWSAGQIHQGLPPTVTSIHTQAVAKIRKGMTVLTNEEAVMVTPRCLEYFTEHEQTIARLNQDNPALISMNLLMRECALVGAEGSRVTRRDAENCTRLEAHLIHLKDLVSSL